MQNYNDSLSPYVNNKQQNFKHPQDYAYQKNASRMMQQQQQQHENQRLQQISNEQQVLIQYYVYQDFQNLINLLYSFQAIKKHFIDQPKHFAINIAINKIILQLNISNSIHYDLQQTNKNSTGSSILQNEKKNVKSMLQKMRNDVNMNDLDKDSQRYLDIYIQTSLADIIQINQMPLEKSNLEYTFNQNVLDQLLPQISFVDDQIQTLKQRKQYHIPSESQIKVKAKEYERITQNKLQINFPKNNYYPKSPNKQDHLNSQFEQPNQYKRVINISQSEIYPHFQNQRKFDY